MKTITLYFLKIYQKFFTLFSFGSCRYYPTCSEYAKWQYEKNNFFLATLHSIIRILKCNQLFRGGIDYPIVKMSLNSNTICYHNANTNKIIVQFWFVPKSDNDYYLIKTFKRNSHCLTK